MFLVLAIDAGIPDYDSLKGFRNTKRADAEGHAKQLCHKRGIRTKRMNYTLAEWYRGVSKQTYDEGAQPEDVVYIWKVKEE